MKNVTVTVSPEAKVEFLMLVNLAMGLEVSQGLEIRDTTYATYITFNDSHSQVQFFSDLHVQWYNKDLKKLPENVLYSNNFCTIVDRDGQWYRQDQITGGEVQVSSYFDESEKLITNF